MILIDKLCIAAFATQCLRRLFFPDCFFDEVCWVHFTGKLMTSSIVDSALINLAVLASSRLRFSVCSGHFFGLARYL